MTGTNLTKLRKKLIPPSDGQDWTKLRTAVVTAVNTDGTLDLTMSGVSVTNVPRLTGAYAVSGSVVQVLSYRGSLLVLGLVAGAKLASPITKTGNFTGGPSAATFYSSAVVFGVTFPAIPNVHVNLNHVSAGAVQWVGRAQSITTTGFTMTSYGPSATFSGEWQWTAIYAP